MRLYDGMTIGIGGRYPVKWREIGGMVTASCTRETAELARAVMALWRYLGFLALSGAERQSRLKNRYGWLVIFPCIACLVREGEKVGTDQERRAVAGYISGGVQMNLRPARCP